MTPRPEPARAAGHPPGCGCLECPDPHEDWYFALLPADWKRMRREHRLKWIELLDPGARAECRRRMRHRAVVAAGRFLAQRERDSDAELKRRTYHGFAVDAALYRILLRAKAYHATPATVAGQPERT